MGVLTKDMQRVVRERPVGFVATVSADGAPGSGAQEYGHRLGRRPSRLHWRGRERASAFKRSKSLKIGSFRLRDNNPLRHITAILTPNYGQ